MKKKIKQNWKITKQKHIKQNKAKHKTKPTQNYIAKHISNAKTKIRKGEREKETKSDEIT